MDFKSSGTGLLNEAGIKKLVLDFKTLPARAFVQDIFVYFGIP